MTWCETFRTALGSAAPVGARRSLALTALLAVAGCLHDPYAGRVYGTPLTSAEGELMVPALVSTAEGMGLQAFGSMGSRHTTRSGRTFETKASVEVRLENGTVLRWFDRSGQFVLGIEGVGEGAEALREARARADQLWELAVEARQANNVGAAVRVPSPSGGNDAAATQPTRPARECAVDRDCASGNCRAGKCVGGGPGAACSFSSDCPSGRCRHGRCE